MNNIIEETMTGNGIILNENIEQYFFDYSAIVNEEQNTFIDLILA